MRDAESALDQLISFCGVQIAESDVLSMFGLTSRSQVVALAGAVLNGAAETALRELNELAQHGKDLGRLLSDLLNHFRNLLIYQVSKGDLNLLEVSETEGASLKEQSSVVGAETLTRLMEVLTEAEGRLRDASSKKIFIEVALLKAIQARNAVSIDSVLKQLHQMRGDGSGGSAAGAPVSASAPAPRAAEPIRAPMISASVPAAPPAPLQPAAPVKPVAIAEPAPVTMAAPANAAGGDVTLAALWRDLLEAVGRASPFTRGYLVEAHPVSLAKGVFTIGFDPKFADHIDLVDNSKTHAILQTKLGELGHPHTQIKVIKAEAPAGWAAARTAAQAPAPVPAPALAGAIGAVQAAPAQPRREKPAPVTLNAEEFKNDPLIQKALEIFKGRIVEVRA
jgi:DNA polymerase-3 subunit gamma/tau